MAQAPMMPVWTDALIGDTTHLSAEQFGAYVLILIATWRNNGRALPDDDRRLAQTARVSVKKWRANVRPILHEFFSISDGRWHQKRLELEWDRVSSVLTNRSAAGKANASQRHANGTSTHNHIQKDIYINDDRLGHPRARARGNGDYEELFEISRISGFEPD